MRCPVCNSIMHSITHLGVELDLCANCKGLWLDDGEYEQLIALEGCTLTRAGSALPHSEHLHAQHPRTALEQIADTDLCQVKFLEQRKTRGTWLRSVRDSFGRDSSKLP